jgi:hypothetical protein
MWRTGLSLGPARERVRVARVLAELPAIDEGLRTGALSYSKVRALTRVATPDNEGELVEIATYSTASQLERICRLYRSCTDERTAPEDLDDRRWVSSRATDDGMVRIQIQLCPDEAAKVMEAMREAAETRDAADGIVAMAEATLSGDAARAGRPPVEVVVHVDADGLHGHTAEGDGIPAEISRRLLCDCGVVPMLDDAAGRIIDVGRKKRTIPPALRRALDARDRCCRYPGCTNHRCDAHHVEHWIRGGETRLDNLLLLCRRHHRFMHEHGFRVELDAEGDATFYDPHDRLVPESGTLFPSVGSLDQLRERLRQGDVSVDAETNAPQWDGRPPQYEFIVNGLLG